MNRREFLGMAAASGIGLGFGASSPTLADSKQQEKPEVKKRKHWAWQGRNDKATDAELHAKFRKFKSHGVEAILLEGGMNEREFAIIKEEDLELHSWMWTTNRGDQWIRENHPDWYMVSRTGESCYSDPPYVDYYRWVSPVIPGVQRFLEDQVAQLTSHPAVSGIHFDYVRYPDIILPRALWAKYNLDQTNELPRYDFCYSDHTRKAFQEYCGRDPLKIEDPAHDQQWLHFRYDTVTNLVKKLVKVAHDHEKIASAAVFPTPHRARKICRQDWDKWPLDAVLPMTYHSFYDKPVEWVGECTLENIQAVNFPVYAGLYMPDLSKPADFKKAIEVTLQNGGWGVSLFGTPSDEGWEAFDEAIG